MKQFRYDLFQGPVVLLAPWPDGYSKKLEQEIAAATNKKKTNLKSKDIEEIIAKARKTIINNNRKHKFRGYSND